MSEKGLDFSISIDTYAYLNNSFCSNDVDQNIEEQIMAIRKAQNFYDRILDGYGDDSIGELGGAHLAGARDLPFDYKLRHAHLLLIVYRPAATIWHVITMLSITCKIQYLRHAVATLTR